MNSPLYARARRSAATMLALSLLVPLAAKALEPATPSVHPDLARHQAAFAEPRVIQVSERVFVAFAYSMCNIVMVVGDEGVAIFDTGFREEEGRAALEALRNKSEAKIQAVIYSHGHADHTGGSRAFAPADVEDPIRVYAQENYLRYLAEMHAATKPIFTRRAVAQLGMILPEGKSGTVGSGGGPVVRFAGSPGYAPPTHVVKERETIDLGGVRLELFHAPGDLDDALAVWIPEEKVLLSGDTVVGTHTHPILSTPRYEKGRDARAYVTTLSRMRDYPAQVLVGGHGAPVVGEAQVADLLERTELVAQFMIDETLRLTRRNLSGPEIAAMIEIPDSLRGDQEFGDYYHRLSWIVRGIHAKEMGWYGGDVVELVAHSPAERARRLIAALGGEASTLDLAEKAYRDDDPRWAAELATLVLSIQPESKRALDLKVNALTTIAYASDSANERNYLLTEARVMSGDLGWNIIARGALNRIKAALVGPTIPESALAAPSLPFIQNLGPRISRDHAQDASLLVELRVTDRDEVYLLGVRNGVVLQERRRGASPDVIVDLTHRSLVLASDGLVSWQELASDDLLTIRKGKDEFARFASYFEE
jgi:alkyl sulfatase BDS1-like metallo-beta-lactamase superfamily hydrolase